MSFPRAPAILEYYGTQIQSAVQAIPIPICYGAPRVPCNIIYVNGFNAVKQKSGGKGGKGLLTGGKGQPVQYLYYATLICAICEGPIGNIIVIYQDSNTYFNLSGIVEVDPDTQTGKSGAPNFVPTNAQFFPGGDQQEPWSYVEGNWPSDARSYKDTCYIGLPNMQLDSTATPPQFNFVPAGAFSGTCPLYPATFTGAYTNNDGEYAASFYAGYVDADPAQCIFDFLTNARYGAGFPSDLIDTGMFSNVTAFEPSIGDAALQTYCQAIGFGFSEVVNNAEAAGSIIERWCKNMAVAIVWNGVTLRFIPYWDQFNGSNPGWGADNPGGIGKKYYAPNVQPLVDLTDDHFLQAQNPEEEPVTLDRVDPVDVYNYVRVSYRDRNNQFNENVAMASDEAAIELFGPRIDNAQIAHEYSLGNYAGMSSSVQLRRNLSVKRHVTYRLPPIFSFFDPMDIVTATSGTLNRFPIRITSIEEDETGAITITAEEFPAGAASPTAFPNPPTNAPVLFQTNVPVESINPPVIVEPTTQMLAAQGNPTPTIIIGLSGSRNGAVDPNWGGCTVYASLDDETYQQLGPPTQGPSRQGVLTATLPAYGGTNPDNTDTLSVDLTESGGELDSTTADIAAEFLTLCAIVDSDGCVEYIAYTTANLSALYTYNLSGLYRGLFGTNASQHIAGAKFLRIDGAAFQTTLPPQFVGKTIFLKMTSFNIYNMADQDISSPSVVAYTYMPNGGGTNLLADPIISALLAGQPVDLQNATDPLAPIDLNAGGFSSCAPTPLAIDLGTF